MANIDPCDQSTFPPSEFFEQNPLSRDFPRGYNYEYTKAYFITAKGTQDGGAGGLAELSDLVFTSTPLFASGPKGTPKAEESWEDVLRRMFDKHWIAEPNPLNIQVYERSRVIILLVGEFWEFSRAMEPMSTKLKTEGRYFDLQRHGWDDGKVVTPPPVGTRCAAISFFSDTPCDDKLGVRHGFSMNVEFTGGGKLGVLPITIDPDVENKGGR